MWDQIYIWQTIYIYIYIYIDVYSTTKLGPSEIIKVELRFLKTNFGFLSKAFKNE